MRVATMAVAFCLGTGGATAHAQHLEYGVKAGPTVATLVDEGGNQGTPYSRKASLGGGAFVVIPWTGPAAVQIEALFTPKGGKLPSDGGVSSTLMFDYLEFPVLARIIVARYSSQSIHVFGGASAGLRINAKFKAAQTGTGFSTGYTDDISSEVHRFDSGVIAGGGVNASRHIVIDARYSWGLTEVNRVAEAGFGVRNRAFTVLAGYRF
jgi:Outer membrane protein beta-barrel domain